MINDMWKKGLVLGIIILFVGASVLPSISGIIENNYSVKDCDTEIVNDVSQTKKRSTSALSDVDWWPMFHHDQCHTGYSTSGAPDLELILWTKDTGKGVTASPVVVDGKLYIGSRDMYLYCLDAETSKEEWKFYMYNDYFISPSTCAVVNERVYFIGTNGVSTVICLDANDGSTIWEYFYGGVFPPSMQIPTVANGKVYFGTGTNNLTGTYILCLDAEGNGDGTTDLLWSFETEYEVFMSPAVYEDRVYAGNARLYCLNASNGNLSWNTPQEYFYSSPACYDGRVYIGSNYGLFCYDAYDGTEIWSQTDVGEIWSTPAIAYGNVYAGSFEGNVYCCDADDGHTIWSNETGGSVYSSPAVADGKVYVGSDDNKFYCLNASNGEILAEYQTGGRVRSSPAIADGKVYVGSDDKKVYAFKSDDIDPEIRFSTPEYGHVYLLRGIVDLGPFAILGEKIIIIGGLDVWVYATDNNIIDRVEFYVNNSYIDDFKPSLIPHKYICPWFDTFLGHNIKIKAVAFDPSNNQAEVEMNISWYFCIII